MSKRLLTCAEAAEILGMTESGVYKLLSRGVLTRRHNGRRDRTGIVDRAEVERVAAERARAKAEHEQRMAEREAARGPVRATTATYVVDEDGTWRWAPPDDVHEWLNTEQAAELIGITSQAIGKRCRKGTIPATRVGTKWWIDPRRPRPHCRERTGDRRTRDDRGGARRDQLATSRFYV